MPVSPCPQAAVRKIDPVVVSFFWVRCSLIVVGEYLNGRHESEQRTTSKEPTAEFPETIRLHTANTNTNYDHYRLNHNMTYDKRHAESQITLPEL